LRLKILSQRPTLKTRGSLYRGRDFKNVICLGEQGEEMKEQLGGKGFKVDTTWARKKFPLEF